MKYASPLAPLWGVSVLIIHSGKLLNRVFAIYTESPFAFIIELLFPPPYIKFPLLGAVVLLNNCIILLFSVFQTKEISSTLLLLVDNDTLYISIVPGSFIEAGLEICNSPLATSAPAVITACNVVKVPSVGISVESGFKT